VKTGTQAESEDSETNILLNIYYETVKAESADSVSNISLVPKLPSASSDLMCKQVFRHTPGRQGHPSFVKFDEDILRNIWTTRICTLG
jgi:hypothetical protein